MAAWWGDNRMFGKAFKATFGVGCAVVVGIIILIAIGAALGPKATPSQTPGAVGATLAPAVTASATATAAAPTVAAPTPFNFGSGKKLVPSEVAAGTYRMRTPAPGCYWERLSGLGGTFGEILANGNPAGPEIVTIAPTDKAFNSSRCAPWSADLSAITTSPTAAFGDGTWQVGVDIAPGTWRSAGGTTCYWQRMKGFSGTFSDIIANDNTGPSTIVEIGASDKAFSSSRCGTWTKV
jgi:hypothetical protein